MKKDNFGSKMFVLSISLVLVGIVTLLYFINNSLEWGREKIVSYVLVTLWIFFIFPALRNSYLLNKGKSLEEWCKMGFHFGSSGIAFPILFAPYFGLRYYFKINSRKKD